MSGNIKGIFYGVSTGPGDPELMTLKACRLIRENDGQGGTHFEGSRRHRSGTCDGKTENRAGNCKAGGLPGEVVKDGLLENEAYGYFTTVIVKE